MKRTPLKRSRKRIRPRSPKREALMVQRRALVERILRERPRCEVPSRMAHGRTGLPCGRPGVHIHEKLTRARGGSILDEANCLVACSKCHRLIHDNPEWATEAGLLISQYGRGDIPDPPADKDDELRAAVAKWIVRRVVEDKTTEGQQALDELYRLIYGYGFRPPIGIPDLAPDGPSADPRMVCVVMYPATAKGRKSYLFGVFESMELAKDSYYNAGEAAEPVPPEFIEVRLFGSADTEGREYPSHTKWTASTPVNTDTNARPVDDVETPAPNRIRPCIYDEPHVPHEIFTDSGEWCPGVASSGASPGDRVRLARKIADALQRYIDRHESDPVFTDDWMFAVVLASLAADSNRTDVSDG